MDNSYKQQGQADCKACCYCLPLLPPPRIKRFLVIKTLPSIQYKNMDTKLATTTHVHCGFVGTTASRQKAAKQVAVNVVDHDARCLMLQKG